MAEPPKVSETLRPQARCPLSGGCELAPGSVSHLTCIAWDVRHRQLTPPSRGRRASQEHTCRFKGLMSQREVSRSMRPRPRSGAQIEPSGAAHSARSTAVHPRRTAARCAVIESAPHRRRSRPRPSRQAARPYVYASPALGVIARFCRCEGVRYRQSGSSLHWDSGWSWSALLTLAPPLRANQKQLAGEASLPRRYAPRSSGGGRGLGRQIL
jgi:hypothetical protein